MGMKLPKPVFKPYLPVTYKTGLVEIFDGACLEDVLKQLPEGIELCDVSFSISLDSSGHCGCCSTASVSSYLRWSINLPKEEIDALTAKYNEDMKQYKKDLVKYKKALKEYNEYLAAEKAKKREAAALRTAEKKKSRPN
jgi:hypothetical protein